MHRDRFHLAHGTPRRPSLRSAIGLAALKQWHLTDITGRSRASFLCTPGSRAAFACLDTKLGADEVVYSALAASQFPTDKNSKVAIPDPDLRCRDWSDSVQWV